MAKAPHQSEGTRKGILFWFYLSVFGSLCQVDLPLDDVVKQERGSRGPKRGCLCSDNNDLNYVDQYQSNYLVRLINYAAILYYDKLIRNT